MYQHHPARFPIADDYGLHAVRSQLNEYPRTPGEYICRGPHFASNFSILFKFKTEESLRFTLLNISDDSSVKFSVVIDMIQNSITLTFSDCNIMEVTLPLGSTNRLQTGQWHRIGVAVDLSFLVVYVDCQQAYTYPINSGCTVVCDETVEIGVLEGANNVILRASCFFVS